MKLFSKLSFMSAVFSLTFFVNIGYAAPGTILDRPLFLGFSVQPNIYFVVDDSGSMDYDVTKTTEADQYYPPNNDYRHYYPVCITQKAEQVCVRQRCRRGSCTCREYDTVYTDEYRTKADGACPVDVTYESIGFSNYTTWYNSGYITKSPRQAYLNPVYDQTLAYGEDWSGNRLDPRLDENGYYDTDLLAMCSGYNAMAYDPSVEYSEWKEDKSGDKYFDDGYGYIPWVDKNGNKKFDKGECSTDASDIIRYSSLNEDSKTNFYNWYVYYRARKNVAKKALGEVIHQSDARMGLNTIWGRIFSPVSDMTNEANKTSLLNSLYSVNSSGGTPLRSALDNAGKYFQGTYSHNSSIKSSPILDEDKGGSCQQNYTVLMTDGYWNGDSTEPNYWGYIAWSGVGDVDGTSTHELVRASDKDNVSNTLADVALKYYTTDFSDLPNNVPTITGKDENSAQHMVTFTVAFGVSGEIVPNSNKSGQVTDATGMPKYPDQPFSWPTPVSDTSSTIDDVRHAAWNGRGLYLNARNPEDLIDALSTSINEIGSRAATASSIAFNSTSYRSDARLYYARFDASNWSGQLIANDLGSDLEVGNQVWEAGEELDNRVNARTIFTHDPSTGNGVAFRDNSLPTVFEHDLLTLYSDKLSSDVTYGTNKAGYLGDAVDYLRGGRDNESINGGFFRNRGSILGDIVNSAPVYIEGAMSNWPAFIEPGYLSYVRSVAGRKPMLVVGANDGMLHGFDATNGSELFGYIPSSIASTETKRGLHYLMDAQYNHRYYVDSTPEVADGYVNGNWKTLAVGGLGAGGKGIYALDVTASSYTENGASSTVLWETMLPGEGLGLTYAQPKVAKMNDGRWVAIVANGYHNTVDGKAKVFILDLDDGSLIKTLDTGSGSLSSGACSTSCNGMSAASTADIDGDGTVDFIYAGDVKGNVWAINVASSNSSEWVFDSQVTYTDGVATSYSGSQKKPIYKTVNGRPITSRIVAVNHPTVTAQDSWPNQLLFFGSGQFIADGDHQTTNQEYFYGVMHANSHYEKSVSTHPSLFAERVVKAGSVTIDGDERATRTIEPKVEDEATFVYGVESGQKLGWYVPLPESGERVVHHPVRQTDYILFNTLIPLSDPCANGGTGYSMAVSLLFGSTPNSHVFDLGSSKPIAGLKLKSLPAGLTTFGNSGIGHSTKDEPEITPSDLFGNHPDRTSWQELR